MVDFGVQVEPQLGYTYDETLRIGQQCEEFGFSTLTISDHFMLREDSTGTPCLECWSLLSALSVDLKEVRIGPLVSCTSYRHPSLLAKMGATVDILSGGRLELGMGAGWKRPEYEAYGYPFPPIGERVERLGEAIEIVRRMWTEDRASFQGRYYAIRGALCNPKPVQRPHPPIWVGGRSEGILRIAARAADGVNIPFSGPEDFGKRVQRLRRHCEEEDRRFSDLRRSAFLWALLGEGDGLERMLVSFAKTLQKTVEDVRRIGQAGYIGPSSGLLDVIERYVEAGANRIILGFPKGWEATSMELLQNDVLSAFR